MTTDPQAAGAFYSKILPWKTQPSGMPDYTVWLAGKSQVAGLMAQPASAAEAGAPPSWLIYIGTPDVDATAAAAERLGGKVLKPPADIPTVGRFAVLADPQGAAFAIFTPIGAPGAAAAAGGFSWHELATSDPQGALGFYSELFGWGRGPVHDMGPPGLYHIIEQGGAQVGGAFKMMDASKPAHWLTYIEVASVDRAAAAAKAAGGRVVQGPMEVPGGSRVAQILDPQGGAFSVHELPRKAAASAPATEPAAARRTPAKRRAAPRKRPAQPASTRRAAARPARKPAAKAKRPAAKRAASKSPARKPAAKRPAARKTAGKKKVAKRSARKVARRR
jgi:predicted enzyme related to lactoylglutathione lyase